MMGFSVICILLFQMIVTWGMSLAFAWVDNSSDRLSQAKISWSKEYLTPDGLYFKMKLLSSFWNFHQYWYCQLLAGEKQPVFQNISLMCRPRQCHIYSDVWYWPLTLLNSIKLKQKRKRQIHIMRSFVKLLNIAYDIWSVSKNDSGP